MPAFKKDHLSDIPTLRFQGSHLPWKPIRHHFGITAFGINVLTAEKPGDPVVEEHTEVDASGTQHEEIYFVFAGSATFTVDGETVDAPTGTFVCVPDPAVTRSAVANEAGTMVLAVGGEPEGVFRISEWENKYFD